MMNRVTNIATKLSLVMILIIGLSGCIGTVVGAVVDTAVEVVKVPFKVGGAVIDVVTPDKEDKFADQLDSQSNENQADINSDEAAILMESEGI